MKPESLRVQVPDREYWKDQIKCQAACPVHTDARGYVRAIAEGEYELAYLIARGPNPLASICGRVCGAPCEAACRRGELDQPVSIRALKRFVCEQYGSEAREEGGKGLIGFLKKAAQKYAPRQCEDREELLPLLQSLMGSELPRVAEKSVGIIGSGPAGLAAAHDLALMGFTVTIYEMEEILAGMLATGIPEYRLPRDLIVAEIEAILELGVEAVTKCHVGVDKSLAALRQEHDAVIIAVGAKKSRALPIPGADAIGVLGGVEFLRDVSLGEAPSLGSRVVVIGGGNVAYDVGRTVLRQTSVDAARTALREQGVGEVHMCSLESLDEMPADDVEIIEGDEEGIIRRNSMGPVAIEVNAAGRVTGVEFRKCLRVFDAEGRFAPEFDDANREVIPCDTVLIAIGQSVDLSFVDADRDALEMDARGLLVCDGETGATSADDVYVAGDLAYGPKLLIHAVASGKAIARSIYQRFTGQTISHRELELHLALPNYRREPGYEGIERVHVPATTVEQRMGAHDRPVEVGYDEAEARCEAARCFDCGVNTIFDGAKCVLCGGCVDVCPELCLRIVSVDRLGGIVEESAREERAAEANAPKGVANHILADTLNRQLDGYEAASASAILKDETICIRCGLCAERCPVGAITMERFQFKETPRCQIA